MEKQKEKPVFTDNVFVYIENPMEFYKSRTPKTSKGILKVCRVWDQYAEINCISIYSKCKLTLENQYHQKYQMYFKYVQFVVC